MTLADYFQPLGLNFLQSPIQLYPSPPLPTPPHPTPTLHPSTKFYKCLIIGRRRRLALLRAARGEHASTSFSFLPSCVLESWLTKNNNNNKLQLNSVNAEVRGGGMESVRVNRMSVQIKQVLKKERFVTARS